MLYAMNYPQELTRLQKLLREVYANCSLNNHELASRIVVSKALITTALNDLPEEDVDALIQSLEVERYIRLAANDQLIVPLTFIEGDKWISNYANYNAA